MIFAVILYILLYALGALSTVYLLTRFTDIMEGDDQELKLFSCAVWPISILILITVRLSEIVFDKATAHKAKSEKKNDKQ